jgi:hypothetical protein
MLLRNPEYCPCFGLPAELAAKLAAPYADAGPAFMAIELIPGALAGGGAVRYPAAFTALEE